MSASGDTAQTPPFRILLIDDNEDANESMGSLLELLGYEVRMARDGETGLQAAQEFQPHLVFLDIGLPDISGDVLAPRIRRTTAVDKLVLAAVTGYGFASDVEKIFDAGFDFHFVKPLDAEVLVDFVATQREIRKGQGTASGLPR